MMNASSKSHNRLGGTETMKTQKALLTHQILEKQGSRMDETQATGIFQPQAVVLLNEVGHSTDEITIKTGDNAAGAQSSHAAIIANRSESRSNNQ